MYKLHYARLGAIEDTTYNFSELNDLLVFLNKIDPEDNRVYLFTEDPTSDSEIIITEWSYLIKENVEDGCFTYTEKAEYVLQEFDSFEAAYDVAKLMKMGNPLCNKKQSLNKQ